MYFVDTTRYVHIRTTYMITHIVAFTKKCLAKKGDLAERSISHIHPIQWALNTLNINCYRKSGDAEKYNIVYFLMDYQFNVN